MNLPFAPACAPMLLGSLPYQNPVQAIEISRRYAGELLAWPQLWQRGFHEQFLVQGAVGFPGLTIDDQHQQVFVASAEAADQLEQFELAYLENRWSIAQLGERDAAGLFELLRHNEAPAGVRALKGQTLGPISLAMQLTDEHERPIIYNPVLFEAIAQFVRMRITWQEQRLAKLGVPTIMCVDEPFLEMVGSPFLPVDWDDIEAQMYIALEDVRGCRAIFASGAIDWGHLLKLNLDLVMGDAYEHSASILGAAESLMTHVEAGRLVGFGIVPTEPETLVRTTAEALTERVVRIVDDLGRAGIDTERLVRQIIITPNSALGAITTEDAEHALRLLAETSKRLRSMYGLTAGA